MTGATGRPENRGIDHLVLCVNDLDKARDHYARLGFLLTPTAHHPFGTANSLVQFDGCFLELLTVAEPGKIAGHDGRKFSFGAFNRDYLEKGEGLSMLVFEGHDARADQREFVQKGLPDHEVFDFERKAQLPDGSQVTVGFSLAFASDPAMKRAVCFTCQQHAPQYFWKPEYQKHPNDALGVREVIMVAEDPIDLFGFYSSIQGGASVFKTGDDLRVRTARGEVCVLSPDAWSARFDGATVPDLADGPVFAGYTVGVANLPAMLPRLRENGIAVGQTPGSVFLPPEENFGALLEFVDA